MIKFCDRCNRNAYATKENVIGVQKDLYENENLVLFNCNCGNTLAIKEEDYDMRNTTYNFKPEALRLVANLMPVVAPENDEDYVLIDSVKWSAEAVIDCLQNEYDNNRMEI